MHGHFELKENKYGGFSVNKPCKILPLSTSIDHTNMFGQSYRVLHLKFENLLKDIKKSFPIAKIIVKRECEFLAELQDGHSEIGQFYRQQDLIKDKEKIQRLIPRDSLRGGRVSVLNTWSEVPPTAPFKIRYLDVNSNNI